MRRLNDITYVLFSLLHEQNVRLILAAVLGALVVPWWWSRRRTRTLVRGLNCGDTYWTLKRELERKGPFRFFSKGTWVFGGLLVVALPATVVLAAIFLLMSFVTLFGIMYVDTGADPTFYENVASLVQIFLCVMVLAACGLYISVCVNLVRSALIEWKIYNILRETLDGPYFYGPEE